MPENNNATDMQALTARTERLIDALTSAILSTAEVAAERIELASQIAQIQQRMAAFTAVLDSVAAAKQPLLTRLETARGPAKALLLAQLDALTAQELAILARAGVPQPTAQAALAVVDAGPATHRRQGRRFLRVGGIDANGNGDANGNAHAEQPE